MSEFKEQARHVLIDAVAKTMGVDKATLTDDTQPIAELGAKSVNIVHMISAIEDEFELEVPFMPFRRQKTIGEMVDYINELYES